MHIYIYTYIHIGAPHAHPPHHPPDARHGTDYDYDTYPVKYVIMLHFITRH